MAKVKIKMRNTNQINPNAEIKLNQYVSKLFGGTESIKYIVYHSYLCNLIGFDAIQYKNINSDEKQTKNNQIIFIFSVI